MATEEVDNASTLAQMLFTESSVPSVLIKVLVVLSAARQTKVPALVQLQQDVDGTQDLSVTTALELQMVLGRLALSVQHKTAAR